MKRRRRDHQRKAARMKVPRLTHPTQLPSHWICALAIAPAAGQSGQTMDSEGVVPVQVQSSHAA